jgi:hypothetical protein
MHIDRDTARRCAQSLVALGAPAAVADLAVVAWLDLLRIDPRDPRDPAGDRLLVHGPGAIDLAGALARLVEAGDVATVSGAADGVLGEAVGMAWGARTLAHGGERNVCVIAPLGEIFAGAPMETAAFAVRCRLDNLVVLTMDDGADDVADDAAEQLAAAGWFVQSVAAHDPMQILAALKRVRGRERPSLIVGRGASRAPAAAVAVAQVPAEVRGRFADRAAEAREWRRGWRETRAAEAAFAAAKEMPARRRVAGTPERLAVEVLAAGDGVVECPEISARERAALARGLALLGATPLLAAPIADVDHLRPLLRQLVRGGLSGVVVVREAADDDDTLWSLRLLRGVTVWRPADGVEVLAACGAALERRGPHVIFVARDLPFVLPRPRAASPGEVERGAYVAAEASTADPTLVILSSGHELAGALAAHGRLEAEGVSTRVVSVPCVGMLAAWPSAQLRRVLGGSAARVVMEPGPALPWRAVLAGDALLVRAGAPAAVLAHNLLAQLGLASRRRDAARVAH